MRDDRPGRGDRQLLARDLEDERPESIEWRKLVHPGSWAETRARNDQLREYGVRLPQELARLAIGERGSLARSAFDAHSGTLPLSTLSGQERVQHGDPSIAHQGHVDAAD